MIPENFNNLNLSAQAFVVIANGAYIGTYRKGYYHYGLYYRDDRLFVSQLDGVGRLTNIYEIPGNATGVIEDFMPEYCKLNR